MKTTFIRARIDPGLKQSTEGILAKLGLTPTEAIRLFYQQVELHNGLPFEIKLPNPETLETFKKTDKGEDLIECKDASDLFNKLGI
ncbi:MAG: type II toxin-antitoxin system RelB/DinJ family antitoxin [Sporomusaceae bacterium]|nr:type II toxin-antitoxin system RelB/DinJ family antitoxin [Sporomusaceae bacterium]